jgi:hypothetical protein
VKDALAIVEQQTCLITLDQANKLLDQFGDLGSLKAVRDEAKDWRVTLGSIAVRKGYQEAKQALIRNECSMFEIKTLAEQRMSKLLSASQGKGKPGGDQRAGVHVASDYKQLRDEAGITRKDYQRWQEIERISARVVAKYVAQCNAAQERPTRGNLIAYAEGGYTVVLPKKAKKKRKKVSQPPAESVVIAQVTAMQQEIYRRRKENNEKNKVWNPQDIRKHDQSMLLDWIEHELSRLTGITPRSILTPGKAKPNGNTQDQFGADFLDQGISKTIC